MVWKVGAGSILVLETWMCYILCSVFGYFVLLGEKKPVCLLYLEFDLMWLEKDSSVV